MLIAIFERTIQLPIAEVSDQSFAIDVEASPTPVLVDFWAEWCGPCRQLAPILDQLSDEYAGRLEFAKLNVDENPETPARFGVRALPTLNIFRGGEIIGAQMGVLPKASLKRWIESSLE